MDSTQIYLHSEEAITPNVAVGARLFRPPLLRRVALSAVFVVGLAACGGAEPGDLATNAGSSTALDNGGFVSASSDVGGRSDVDEDPSEALAETESEEVVEGGEPATALVEGSPASPPDVQGNHSVLSSGQLFLRGTVASQEVSDLTVAAFEEILGEGNVFAEYEIDTDVVTNSEEVQSIYLADAVLFESDSADIGQDFVDVLSFSPLLLAAQPDVTLWAFGHTDSVGDAEANLRLSQERVDAVRDWVIENGGDEERIFASGEGEGSPIADNGTEEGRAQNRRVEFTIAGFDIGLDG